MSNETSSAGGSPAQAGRTRRIVFLVLVFLSIGGIGIMDYSEKYALWYWLSMAPIFGAASLGLAWNTAYQQDASAWLHVRRQLFHWLTLVVSLLLLFLMQRFDHLAPDTGGLVALLLLGTTTVLAGVHFEWRMAVLGGILLLTFIAGVFVDTFFWVLLIPSLLSLVLLMRGHGYDKV